MTYIDLTDNAVIAVSTLDHELDQRDSMAGGIGKRFKAPIDPRSLPFDSGIIWKRPDLRTFFWEPMSILVCRTNNGWDGLFSHFVDIIEIYPRASRIE